MNLVWLEGRAFGGTWIMMASGWLLRAGGAGLLLALAMVARHAEAAGEGARWGARDPVLQCAEIESDDAPSQDAVIGLIRCEREAITASDELWLLEDVSVRIGAAREHQGHNEFMTMPEADTAAPVHPLRGAWTWVVCRDPRAMAIVGGDPAANCSHARVEKAEGACWKTTFGNWRCNMTGPAASAEKGFPPPR